jgi:hypothetical protein
MNGNSFVFDQIGEQSSAFVVTNAERQFSRSIEVWIRQSPQPLCFRGLVFRRALQEGGIRSHPLLIQTQQQLPHLVLGSAQTLLHIDPQSPSPIISQI